METNPTPQSTTLRQPCNTYSFCFYYLKLKTLNRSIKRLVRFSVDYQFSAHTPLLVRTPVNSFEFEPYDRSSPAEYLTR